MNDLIVKRAEELASELYICDCEVSKIIENIGFDYSAGIIDAKKAAESIDHTILSFNATEKDILRICNEAGNFRFKAICINPVWVKTAFNFRKKTDTAFLIATVVDFPLGASTIEARIAETKQALADGADEIDLVISVGMIKSRKMKETYELIKGVAETDCYLKVILETSELTINEKIDAALISVFSGAHMLKTSTGVNGKATIEDVKLLRAIAGKRLGVKAAGGIRDKHAILEMIKAGADRIGCSSSTSIMSNW